jgi:hypothetical protein
MKAVRNSPRFAVIHIAKSLKKAIARPKLVKEYACPNTLTDRGKEVLATTMYKNNSRDIKND